MWCRPCRQPTPERVVVIGCAGSGKTTLAHARRLRFSSPRQAAAWLAGVGR
jgi:ABC-type cobalamin/Fe3+-siderophores transport system ATPase subunit